MSDAFTADAGGGVAGGRGANLAADLDEHAPLPLGRLAAELLLEPLDVLLADHLLDLVPQLRQALPPRIRLLRAHHRILGPTARVGRHAARRGGGRRRAAAVGQVLLGLGALQAGEGKGV